MIGSRRGWWLVAGLALALGVAFYVARGAGPQVPSPVVPSALDEVYEPATSMPLAPPRAVDDGSQRTAAQSDPVDAPRRAIARESSGHLVVHVVDRRTRAPLAGMTVVTWKDGTSAVGAENTRAAEGSLYERLRTNAEGRVDVWVEPMQSLNVWTYSEDESTDTERTMVHAPAAGATLEVTLAVAVGSDMVLELRFVDRDSGAPIRTGHVRGLRAGVRHALDDGGRVLIDWTSYRQKSVVFEIPGYGNGIVEPVLDLREAGEPQTIRLSALASVRLRLTDADLRPEADTLVRATVVSTPLEGWQGRGPPRAGDSEPERVDWSDAWSTTTDASGTAVLRDLPARTSLRIQFPKRPKVASPPTFQLSPGEVREIEWTSMGTATVRGRVVDWLGQPVSSVQVVLSGAEPRVPGTRVDPSSNTQFGELATTTDAAGYFSFNNRRVGSWWVGLGSSNARRGLPGIARPRHVRVETARQTVDVVLTLVEPLTIAGKVLDRNERGVEHATVVARATNSPHSYEARTSADGTFRFERVLPGTYVVGQDPESSLCPSSVTATAGDTSLVLRLQECGFAWGRVVDASGVGSSARVILQPATGTSTSPMVLWTNEEGLFGQVAGPRAPVTLTATTARGECGRAQFDLSQLPAESTIGYDDRGVIVTSFVTDPAAESTRPVIVVHPGATLALRLERSERVHHVELWHDGSLFAHERHTPGAEHRLVAPGGRAVVKLVLDGSFGPVREHEVDLTVGLTHSTTLTVGEN